MCFLPTLLDIGLAKGTPKIFGNPKNMKGKYIYKGNAACVQSVRRQSADGARVRADSEQDLQPQC